MLKLWQMLLPLRQMLSPLLCQEGRCYRPFLIFVADVKPHCFRYLLQQLKMADVIAKWQME